MRLRDVIAAFKKAGLNAGAAVAAAITPAPLRTRDPWLSNDEHVAEVNREGAARRAERARVLDMLLSGRSRWIPPRSGWLAPRSRERERW